MRFFFISVATLLFGSIQAQDTVSVLKICDAVVNVVRHQGMGSGALYYNMHDDENTSVEAMDSVLDEYGGVLYELVHTGGRYIVFKYDSFSFEFDPNRVYTEAGVWNQIRKPHVRDSVRGMEIVRSVLDVMVDLGLVSDPVNTIAAPEMDSTNLNSNNRKTPFSVTLSKRDTLAFKMIRSFSDSLLRLMRIDSQSIVIALHNNKEDGYSMASYRIDSIYQSEALAVYMGWHPDPDDFYFVTDRRTFEALQPGDYHIVLQDNALMTDDGSLSVYCGQRGITYINIEAQHGHLKEQIEMLRFLNARIPLLLK